MSRPPLRLGVFGGTFDPPHLGHLVVAQEVHHQLGLDRVLWVPAALPPHKQGRDISPGDVRLEMVRAAIDGDPRFQASDLELRRAGPSYTVDTLRELRAAGPADELALILGADQLAELATWREPDEIRRLAHLVGFSRAGDPPPGDVSARIVQVPRIDVSSTDLRRRVGAGEPLSYLVPPAVEVVIRRQGLYSAGAGSPVP